MMRAIHEIAADIRADWKSIYYGAEPYIAAMEQLDTINDTYGYDSAISILNYFLSNSQSWRGFTAKEIKQEIKDLIYESEN